MAAVDDFIQFINDNWNKKQTKLRASDMLDYVDGEQYNPNDKNVYGLESDLFYDNFDKKWYFKAVDQWSLFLSGGSGDINYIPNVSDNTPLGITIGHMDSDVTAAELKDLSFSDVLDKLFFGVQPTLNTNPYYFKSGTRDILTEDPITENWDNSPQIDKPLGVNVSSGVNYLCVCLHGVVADYNLELVDSEGKLLSSDLHFSAAGANVEIGGLDYTKFYYTFNQPTINIIYFKIKL